MHQSRKPVRKCNGCGLNLRDKCGIYDNPHTQWQRRNGCPGHMNDALLEEYKARMEKERLDARKMKRKEAAKQRKDEPHHDGDRHVLISTVQ